MHILAANGHPAMNAGNGSKINNFLILTAISLLGWIVILMAKYKANVLSSPKSSGTLLERLPLNFVERS